MPMSSVLTLPQALNARAVTKLIESRNSACVAAVEQCVLVIYHGIILAFIGHGRLLKVTANDDEAIEVIQTSGRDCVPVNPLSKKVESFADTRGKEPSEVPSSSERPSIGIVLEDIQEELWYNDQIQYKRTFEARDAQPGESAHPKRPPFLNDY